MDDYETHVYRCPDTYCTGGLGVVVIVIFSSLRWRGRDFISFVLVSSVCLPPDIILFFSATAGDLWCVEASLHTAVSGEKKQQNKMFFEQGPFLTKSCSGHPY